MKFIRNGIIFEPHCEMVIEQMKKAGYEEYKETKEEPTKEPKQEIKEEKVETPKKKKK